MGAIYALPDADLPLAGIVCRMGVGQAVVCPKRNKSEIYKKVMIKEFAYCYRLMDEDGVKTAYLMDFRESNQRTSHALYKAAKHIVRVEKIDLIMFVGLLRLKQYILLPLPGKYVPQQLPLTFYLLNEKLSDKFDFFKSPENWNFSLMNFDVR